MIRNSDNKNNEQHVGGPWCVWVHQNRDASSGVELLCRVLLWYLGT